MEKIKQMVEMNSEYIMICFYVALAAVVVTYIVHFATRKIRFPKYIPGLILMGFGIVNFFRIYSELFVKETIPSIATSIATIGGGLIALCYALILGIINKNRYDEEEYYEDYEESEEHDY
ncbi:MAG: hypothetical protein Q4P29_04615 [Tissierellia bacterium]|nr:hypothetical protein [Tissierellia bacterium]